MTHQTTENNGKSANGARLGDIGRGEGHASDVRSRDARLRRFGPQSQFPFGAVPWKHKMLSVMTSRQHGITGSASLWVRRLFAAVAMPKRNPFFAKACAALGEIQAFSLALGCVSKLRKDLQTQVGVQHEFAASWRGGDPASSLRREDF